MPNWAAEQPKRGNKIQSQFLCVSIPTGRFSYHHWHSNAGRYSVFDSIDAVRTLPNSTKIISTKINFYFSIWCDEYNRRAYQPEKIKILYSNRVYFFFGIFERARFSLLRHIQYYNHSQMIQMVNDARSQNHFTVHIRFKCHQWLFHCIRFFFLLLGFELLLSKLNELNEWTN